MNPSQQTFPPAVVHNPSMNDVNFHQQQLANQQRMMMQQKMAMQPPPPRPPTAMSTGAMSRPGTSMSHRPDAISPQQIQALHQQITHQMSQKLAQGGTPVQGMTPQLQAQFQMQVQREVQRVLHNNQQQRLAQMNTGRPQSRMGTPQIAAKSLASHQSPPPTPQGVTSPPQQGSPPPTTPTQTPGSPSFLRVGKRKLGENGDRDTPEHQQMAAMQQQQQQQQQQLHHHQQQMQQMAAMQRRQTSSPRPDSAMNMNMMGMNANMGNMNQMGMNMGMGLGGVNPMMVDSFGQMGNMGGMPMNNMGGMGMSPTMMQQQQQQQQPQQRQRQNSMPPPPSLSASSSTASMGSMGNIQGLIGGIPSTPQPTSSHPNPGAPLMAGNVGPGGMSLSQLAGGMPQMNNMGTGGPGSMNPMAMNQLNAMQMSMNTMNNMNAINNMGGIGNMNNINNLGNMGNMNAMNMNNISQLPNQMNMGINHMGGNSSPMGIKSGMLPGTPTPAAMGGNVRSAPMQMTPSMSTGSIGGIDPTVLSSPIVSNALNVMNPMIPPLTPGAVQSPRGVSATPSGSSMPPSALPMLPTNSIPNVPPSIASPTVSHDSKIPIAATSGGAPLGPVIPALPPLPANVNLNPSVTKVTPVPLVDSLTLIPALTSNEIENIQEWMTKDKEYEERSYKKMKEGMNEEVREAFLRSGMWWDKGTSGIPRGLKPPASGAAGVVMKRHPGPGGFVADKEWFWSNMTKYRRLPVFSNVRGGGYAPVDKELFDVRYPPRSRGAHQSRSRNKIKREGLKVPRRLNAEEADRPEQLIPIRLEFDVEHHRMRDTFIWNMNDPVVTPEHFAQSLVEDYNLPLSYHGVIAKSIHDQIADFRSHSFQFDGLASDTDLVRVKPPTKPDEAELVARGKLDERSLEWWKAWRRRVRVMRVGVSNKKRGKMAKRVKKEEGVVKRENADGDEADVEDEEEDEDDDLAVAAAIRLPGDQKENALLSLHEIPLNEATMHEEMRIVIKLDIIVGSMKLDDQFEWDIEGTEVTPEEFAEVYTRDLGLGGEFKTSIAHSIREQVQTYQKSLFLVGHINDGSFIQDDELRQSFLPSLVSGARAPGEVSQFTPTLNYLSDGEIDRTEKERDKDLNKRRKRNTRGRRGVALPDREPIRTYRTPAVGFPELDPATMALAVASAAPTSSRRAAAAAASLTIANMVASENSNSSYSPPLANAPLPSVSAQPVQPPPNIMPVKEKKVKGLFKGPSFPSSVLRPRAQVAAPTLSTAADVNSLPAPLENDPPIVQPIPQLEYRNRLLNARRAKELEREAKAQEFVDGQHPNFIDGVWHCSNCGCPESIAIGRRKGPLGDKSQCGTCGKYWHRHRRPRPAEWNPDAEWHSGLAKREAEARVPVSKKKGAGGGMEMLGDDEPMSPVSSASSEGEGLPLAVRSRVNGNASRKEKETLRAEREREQKERDEKERKDRDKEKEKEKKEKEKDGGREKDKESVAPVSSSSGSASAPVNGPQKPPEWLTNAMHAMQKKYTNDKFDVILRKTTTTPEWRIKCLDCPGKLYTPGPGETLSNYEVHLKNRLHRQRVNERLGGGVISAGSGAGGGGKGGGGSVDGSQTAAS
ncbi:SNF5-domain-containing protein [Coprinopsis marcescibilis]|uniref:SNF5-domain-containing protein n=1 Tax=Coprinopsis marcescibilis TaxID=230819 RepID=A0A5C3KHB4_COPMA|nr:SNF5-domain-containing protein [Coprinopsis marcescibilis]